MGWKKWIKRTIKKVTKPVSKVFKGVAKGIAKVGKSVMRGVSRISKKLGPLGMIAMSVAMPYALGGLSSIVGQGAGYMSPASGLMGSKYTFLRAVGQVGNQIRTGYRIASGALGTAKGAITKRIGSIGNTITNTIRKTFTKFSNPSGKGNWFTKISEGAKNLFNAAKNVVTGQPKGTVQISGESFGGLKKDAFTLSSADAQKLYPSLSKEGVVFSNQTVGTSSADKFITETINKASENTVKLLDKDALKHYNNVKDAMITNKSYTNNQAVLDEVFNNAGTQKNYFTDFSTSPDSYSFDFSKSKDYTLGTARDRVTEGGTYNFTGGETFNTPVGKVNKYTNNIIKKTGSTIYNTAKDYLFKPDQAYEEFAAGEFIPTDGASSNDGYLPSLSSTDVKGSSGSDDYAKVFGTEAWQKLKNYHKQMNYQGSMDYYGGN
jgi:hypothetical protein